MRSRKAFLSAAVLCSLTGLLLAQQPRIAPRGAPGGTPQTGPGTKPAGRAMPTDPKLVAFHRDFVQKVEKLALQYESAKQMDKARTCYEEILKLVPEYPPARSKLDQMIQKEATAERKVIDIQANREWQDTGVITVPGKPMRIACKGSWTFNMSHQLGPTGMEIPKELRDFNLGSMIGIINTGAPVGSDEAKKIKPFLIGDVLEFFPDQQGRLMLRMYDSDNTDNAGRVSVEITGTFEKG